VSKSRKEHKTFQSKEGYIIKSFLIAIIWEERGGKDNKRAGKNGLEKN